MRHNPDSYPYDDMPKETKESDETLTEEGLVCREPMRKPWEPTGGRSESTIPKNTEERY